MAFRYATLKSKWARHSMRTSIILLGIGLFVEVLVVILLFVVRYLYLKLATSGLWAIPAEPDRNAFLAISIFGFIGSLILAYGVLSYTKGIRLSDSAKKYVYCSIVIFLSYRAFDILQTWHWEILDTTFGLSLDLDIMISNVLLVGSGLTVLVGMMRALYDANQSSLRLEAQNIRLDHEIKERQKSESQTRASEEKLSAILNAIASPIFLTDASGNVLAHNRVFAGLLGRGRKTLTDAVLPELIPEAVYEEGEKRVRKVFTTGAAEHFVLFHNGRSWEVHMYPVNAADGPVSCVTVAATDITEALQKEDERRLLETAVNNAAECILITDTEGRIEYVNPAFKEQTGYTRAEVMGRTPAILKSGKQEDAFYAELWQTIKRGEVWRGRFINRKKDGELFHENATISPIMREDGQIDHFVAVKRDVTQEHLLELQLQQAQKIEALGTLAGGIAHDLNNILAIILGRSELVLDMLDEDHPARESLDTIIRTAARSSKLIKHLLTFTRQSSTESGPLNIASLIKEQIKLIRTFIPSNVRLVENILTDQEIVTADPSEIQQIVVNILNNANQALQPEGGIIEATLDSCVFEEDFIATTGLLKAGRYIRFRVRDTGVGMSDEILHRIFDPFFTTKDLGEGTGLGLSMVHRSVLRAGGQVHVQSVPQNGSEFDVYWPEAPREALPEPVSHERVSGKGISVLLIDDLADFNDLLAINLRNHGYTVKAFCEPAEALDYFRNCPDEFHIAVVDYMMPKMNGKEVARRLHELRPDLPIILLSGYASGITVENAEENGFCALFDKPVEIDKLSRDLARLARR